MTLTLRCDLAATELLSAEADKSVPDISVIAVVTVAELRGATRPFADGTRNPGDPTVINRTGARAIGPVQFRPFHREQHKWERKILEVADAACAELDERKPVRLRDSVISAIGG